MDYTGGEWKAIAKRKARYWQAEIRTPDVMDAEGKHAVKFGQLIAVCYGPNTVANANLIAAAVNGCVATKPNNPQAIAQAIKDMYQTLESLTFYIQQDGVSYSQLKTEIEKARQALAKAEGKI